MRIFKQTYKDREGNNRKASKWYLEFKDHRSIKRKLAGFTQKRSSEDLGNKVESLVSCRASGSSLSMELNRAIESFTPYIIDKLIEWDILTKEKAHSSKSIAVHLADWSKKLESEGRSPDHIKQTVKRANKVIKKCSFNFLNDIEGQSVIFF